jgi:two-component system, cell cycle sensor histidine kinase and response regulator CckA
MTISRVQASASATARILIVEDEGIIAAHIASLLSKTGYEVAGIVESSEEALAKIPELDPALVLMDIRIKGSMDGIETTAKLRERLDVPVVYLTAHTDQQTIDRAKMTGAFGFLAKPIHRGSLATTIEMAIHKHRADRAVREQRAWMSTVLGTMADAMAVIDRDGKVQFLNSPAEELTGWGNEEARNRDIAVVLPVRQSASGSSANEVLCPPSSPQPPGHLPPGLFACRRSGKRFPIEGEIAPSVDNGRVVGAVVTFRDATSRQARENEIRQQHKMQAVGRLAAGVAHDFNNLLFIIMGYTEEMLRTSALNDPDLKALIEIRKAGENATSITQRLLKFSRREPLEKQDVNLNEVIRDMEELFRRQAGSSIRWGLLLEQGLGAVRADAGQLKQVLMNMVGNACDAMPGGGKVTVETANVEMPRAGSPAYEREAFVALSVTDTGTGMSAETAEHMFEPFFTTKEPGRGTGLGLSIIHSIITDLGGTIHVDSEPGNGATFTVYLPRAAGAREMPVTEDAVSAEFSEPATVLLVEDQEAVRRLLRDYLVNTGCSVLEATNGEEAIRISGEYDGAIDLLITDVMMPRASGFAVARRLAERRAGMKIMFISGYAEELENGLESLPAGARFLPKPFARTDLLKNVNDLLGRGKVLTMRVSG